VSVLQRESSLRSPLARSMARVRICAMHRQYSRFARALSGPLRPQSMSEMASEYRPRCTIASTARSRSAARSPGSAMPARASASARVHQASTLIEGGTTWGRISRNTRRSPAAGCHGASATFTDHVEPEEEYLGSLLTIP